jgi:hypothetical protein|tara:strand:- start:36 stop:377 length:342 start_codon:yes stop_codon:yes gene_type:complete
MVAACKSPLPRNRYRGPPDGQVFANFIGIDPLPDDYPVLGELVKAFGQHTFYLTGDGLHIFEYTETPVDSENEAVLVRIASWSNEDKTDLFLHKPKLTGIKIHFAATPRAAAG